MGIVYNRAKYIYCSAESGALDTALAFGSLIHLQLSVFNQFCNNFYRIR